MSYYRCPDCGGTHEIFGAGGGTRLAQELGVPLLGRLPISADLPEGGDRGTPAVWQQPEGEVAEVFLSVAARIDAMSW
ncbi:hypothetical protein B1A_08952 [mine drainage metagenome]|uniref:Uncharacterized protein n=1 Tax=mine drainage metagenome TaxID=410659 RepID=T1CB97_9ZZZZ